MNKQSSPPECVREALGRLRQDVKMDPAAAAELLQGLEICPYDLEPWVDLEHPVEDSYGRKLIARGANFELMLMSWAPGDFSAIHDHGVAEWGAVRYFGEADHVVFGIDDGALKIRNRMTTADGLVYPVDHNLIHLMGNRTSQPMLSLHLYGRDEAAESITGSARVFDLCEERVQRTDGGVFFCLPESEVSSREACPRADRETTVLHHRLMLDRMARMGDRRAEELERRLGSLELAAA